MSRQVVDDEISRMQESEKVEERLVLVGSGAGRMMKFSGGTVPVQRKQEANAEMEGESVIRVGKKK